VIDESGGQAFSIFLVFFFLVAWHLLSFLFRA
jgi:hypothetical protein